MARQKRWRNNKESLVGARGKESCVRQLQFSCVSLALVKGGDENN